MSTNYADTPLQRRGFYKTLAGEIQHDQEQVNEEVDELWTVASDLGQCEFRLLNDEGRTSEIEQCLTYGKDIFRNGERRQRRNTGI